MSRGYLQAEIDKLRVHDKLTQVLNTEFVRKKAQAQEEAEAPAKSTRSMAQKHPRKSPKKPAQKKRRVLSDLPKDEEEWVGRRVAIAEHFNLADINTLLKVNKYVFANGQWEVFPTPKMALVCSQPSERAWRLLRSSGTTISGL